MNCAWPVASGELVCDGELTELGEATVFVASEILEDPTATGRTVTVYACEAHLGQARALIGSNGLHGLSIDSADLVHLHVPAFGEWPPPKEDQPLDD